MPDKTVLDQSWDYVQVLRRELQASGRDADRLLSALADSVWEEKGYGRKLNVNLVSEPNFNLLLIQIDPGKSTALGVKPEELDQYGLRAHPGAEYEKITVLGFADVVDSVRPVLHYRFRPRHSDEVREQDFGVGASFLSVQMDRAQTGYWHENVNSEGSQAALVLLIEAKNMSYDGEVHRLNIRYEDLGAEAYRNWLNSGAGSILSDEAKVQIQKIDDEYAKDLVMLDDEQNSRRLERGPNQKEITRVFEERLMAASAAHSVKVLTLIELHARPSLVNMLRESYRRNCIDVFIGSDGRLAQYYAELEEINKRHGVLQ